MSLAPQSPDRFNQIKESALVIVDQADQNFYTLSDTANHLIAGDALVVMKKLPSESVDLIFIDPPYFLQLTTKKLNRWKVGDVVQGVHDEWDQFPSNLAYDEFLKGVRCEAGRLMKPSASLWAIATYHNLFRVGKIMQDLGFWFLNDVVWVKPNPMPNWLRVRFTNATETLIWALRDRHSHGYTFDKDQARDFGVGSIGANVWVIPTCTGKERLRDHARRRIHSTQKPLELMRRIILCSSHEGDVVLDPMAGVGTTGYAARMLNRQFIMIETNPNYVQATIERFHQSGDIRSAMSEKRRRQYSIYLKAKKSD